MTTRLTKLAIDRIDLVTKGSNPGAHVLIAKSDVGSASLVCSSCGADYSDWYNDTTTTKAEQTEHVYCTNCDEQSPMVAKSDRVRPTAEQVQVRSAEIVAQIGKTQTETAALISKEAKRDLDRAEHDMDGMAALAAGPFADRAAIAKAYGQLAQSDPDFRRLYSKAQEARSVISRA